MSKSIRQLATLVTLIVLIVSCHQKSPNEASVFEERSQITAEMLQAAEMFWENTFDLPPLIDSLSWKEIPIADGISLIRWRKLRNEGSEKSFFEVNYYTQDGTFQKAAFWEYDRILKSAHRTEAKRLIQNISLKAMEEHASTRRNFEAQEWIDGKSTRTTGANSPKGSTIAQAPEPPPPPSCTWNWGMTDPMNAGYYWEHANKQGQELNWIFPSVSWTSAQWAVSITTLHQSPWWFNDIISSLAGDFQYKSLYCEQEDILKRRVMYTNFIRVWKNANFGNPTNGFTFYINTSSVPFRIYTLNGCSYDLGQSGCDWDSFWGFDNMNDDITSIRVDIKIFELTY